MREDYYAEYAVFEERNWWFVSRRTILTRVLRKFLPEAADRRILDAGCGTGINLVMLREFGQVDGVDVSEKAIQFCHARGETGAQCADLMALPFADDAYDLVTALDVLEHLEDDTQALRELARVCRPGGKMLLTVPAFPSLWSDHDIVNEHRRRYRPREMRALVEEMGLEIEHWSGMNLFLFPVAYSWRTYRRLFTKPVEPGNHRADNTHSTPLVNAILRTVFTAETPFITGPGLPTGLSILCLAEKKA